MYPLDPLHTQDVYGVLDSAGDHVGRLDFVAFYVHHADAEFGFRFQFFERLQFIIAAPRELEYEMIDVQLVEERHQVFPIPFLDRLPAVVAEAEVQCFLALDAAQREVERLVRPLGILGVAGQVGLVHLDHRRVDRLNLFAQHLGERHRQRANVSVLPVDQCAGQHVRRGEGEHCVRAGQPPEELPIARQIQSALGEWPLDDAGRLGTKAHPLLGGKLGQVLPRESRRDAAHRPDEIVDHAVGLRVAHVEARQLTVGDQVDPGQFLRLEHDEDGIAQGGCGGVGGEPRRNGVAAHDLGFDFRFGHCL